MSFISFKPEDDHFNGYLSLDAVNKGGDLEVLIKRASLAYQESIRKMKKTISEIEESRKNQRKFYARTMWDMGNAVFELRDKLAKISLEIDSMYNHLERDLIVKQKWLEKAIILRRYIEKRSLIPQKTTWSRFEHSTRKKAEMISKGFSIE